MRTVAGADKIVVLKEGTVAEQGNLFGIDGMGRNLSTYDRIADKIIPLEIDQLMEEVCDQFQ